jgi:hypothetical protein
MLKRYNHWVILFLILIAYMITGYYDSMDATLAS